MTAEMKSLSSFNISANPIQSRAEESNEGDTIDPHLSGSHEEDNRSNERDSEEIYSPFAVGSQ